MGRKCVHRNLGPPTPSARLPTPVQPKTLPMPPEDRLRLYNCHSVQHRRKQAIEPDKDQSVGDRQLRFRRNAPAQYVQLMPQQDDLRFQPRLRPERRDHDVEKQVENGNHRASAYLIPSLTPARTEYSVRTAGCNEISTRCAIRRDTHVAHTARQRVVGLTRASTCRALQCRNGRRCSRHSWMVRGGGALMRRERPRQSASVPRTSRERRGLRFRSSKAVRRTRSSQAVKGRF